MIEWDKPIIDAIARRRAVLLIGSGVSANAATDAGVRPPTWGDFLKTAFNRLGAKPKYIRDALSRFSYLEACDYLKIEHGASWNELIREFFASPPYKPASIHTSIFELDCRIVASLNFDKIYENYAISASEGTVIVKNYYDDDMRQVMAGADRYVLKPHGSVDSMSKLIFTLEDYGRARVKYSVFYEMLTALLHTHIFICIGCGLSDPDMQLIFEDYKYKHFESPHFIIMPSTISDAQAAMVQRTRGLNVIKYSARDNHKELTESLSALVSLVTSRRERMALERDW